MGYLWITQYTHTHTHTQLNIYLYVPVHLYRYTQIYEDTLNNNTMYVSSFLGKPTDEILEKQETVADFLGKGMHMSDPSVYIPN